MSPGILAVAPIVVPVVSGMLALAVPGSKAKFAVVLVANAALLAVAVALVSHTWQGGVLVLETGDWPAPFGITLAVDTFGAAMVLVTAIIALAASVYAIADIHRQQVRLGFLPLLQIMLAGVCGAFVTGDLFNLYVWFEVMLIASFGLLVLGGDRGQIRAAVPYVLLNLVSTVLLLSAIGLLHGATGTLNFADLHLAVAASDQPDLLRLIAALFLVAFAIKAAMFPLFFWLPASYHAPPVVIAAVFAGLLTKVGVFAMMRVFTIVFDLGNDPWLQTLLLAGAAATMITGVLGAAVQDEMRRVLSFHIISQIGYIVLGLALFTPLALAAGIFYVLHHILVKANLFLVAGIVRERTGSTHLDRAGGLWQHHLFVAVLFLVPALSLAGFPPLSGFWAKTWLIGASFHAGHVTPGIIALIVGLLTVYSMMKIWSRLFLEPQPDTSPPPPPATAGRRWLRLGPVTALAALTLAIGLWPQPLVDLASDVAGGLLNPSVYVEAVLGSRAGDMP